MKYKIFFERAKVHVKKANRKNFLKKSFISHYGVFCIKMKISFQTKNRITFGGNIAQT